MIHMARFGGWLRIAIGVLFVAIVLAAVGLGWVRPGLLFYLMTSLVGLLVWLDYEFNHSGSRPRDQVNAIETTAPDVHSGGGASHP